MTLTYNKNVDMNVHVQYLTTSKGYSDECACFSPKQVIALNICIIVQRYCLKDKNI